MNSCGHYLRADTIKGHVRMCFPVNNKGGVKVVTYTTTARGSMEVKSVVRGHHVYKSVWTPVSGEELAVAPEANNSHDRSRLIERMKQLLATKKGACR